MLESRLIKRLLDRCRPGRVVVATQHVVQARAAIVVAWSCGIPSVYESHVPMCART